ncbi:MAG: hypothetical protein ABIH29_04695 [Candidatus Micrarchaeota archaeon]
MTNASVVQNGQVNSKRPFVEMAFPKPVRKAFRWMNYRFNEHGSVIHTLAKSLPEEQKAQVDEHGKRFCAARLKKNVPMGFRTVLTSLVIGQGMWYLVCPWLSHQPGIENMATLPRWLLTGGLDKLFLTHEGLLYHTDGYSRDFALGLASRVPQTVGVGLALFAAEIATDFSRCWIERWQQKTWGILPDGAARLYGQARPFPVRYSSLEAYQKIISVALRPWALGTPAQIFSSITGIFGSIWRTGPQVLLVATLGRGLDKFFKKAAGWTRLSKIANKIFEAGKKEEEKALEDIRKAVGNKKSVALDFMLAADSKLLFKLNPFRQGITLENAEKAAEITLRGTELEEYLLTTACGDRHLIDVQLEFRKTLAECLVGVDDIFGKKALAKVPDYQELMELMDRPEWDNSSIGDMHEAAELLGATLENLRTERVIR